MTRDDMEKEVKKGLKQHDHNLKNWDKLDVERRDKKQTESKAGSKKRKMEAKAATEKRPRGGQLPTARPP